MPAVPSNGRGNRAVEVLYRITGHEFSERPFHAIGTLTGPQIDQVGDGALQFRASASLLASTIAIDDLGMLRHGTLQGDTNISHLRLTGVASSDSYIRNFSCYRP